MKYRIMHNYTRLKCLTICAVAATLFAIALPDSRGASIIFTTDTETELTGTFSAQGFFDAGSATPSNFQLLPPGLNKIGILRDGFLFKTSLFSETGFGSPDNPFVAVSNRDSSSGTQSGYYDNTGPFGSPGPRVDFVINYDETGGSRGTFSGDFSFRRANVPDGGTTALLLGLGLFGLLLTQRFSRMAPQA